MKTESTWAQLRADRPGERFENLYRRRREERKRSHAALRWLTIAGGVGLALVGVVLLPAPGPGWLVIALGLGLLGSEFRSIARFLDASELKLRGWASAVRQWWKNAGRKPKATTAPESPCARAAPPGCRAEATNTGVATPPS